MSNQSATNGEAGTIQQPSLDDTDTESHQKDYCSFALTGPQEIFQAIYICRSCCSDGSQPGLACFCEACALTCHDNHEGLEYVGTGPSYCDCHQLAAGCKLEDCSREKAAQLDLCQGCLHVDSAVREVSCQDGDDVQYVRDVFTIRALIKEDQLYSRLQLHCKELVKHSRETFWLDDKMDVSKFCDLELLAWSVFQQHVKHYELQVSSPTSSYTYGAEWWVQVKPVSAPESGKSRLEAYTNGSEAVDLHYDKDEDMAESFGLGSFPTLSTVTYLTDDSTTTALPPPPTVIFPHRYDENDQAAISNMIVSHPRRGKHLVFDGRLLHGAPSHYALRPLSLDTTTTTTGEEEEKKASISEQWRITFLVNVWIGHKPAGVHVLPAEIRDVLQREHDPCHTQELLTTSSCAPLFESREIVEVHVNGEEDLPLSLRGRIELPFLGKGTTWENEDEEDAGGGGMALVTYPPPDHEVDTLLVRFGPNMEAFLHDLDGDEDDEEEA
jgi:hypothetical protein